MEIKQSPFSNKKFVEALKFAKPEEIIAFHRAIEAAGLSETPLNVYNTTAYISPTLAWKNIMDYGAVSKPNVDSSRFIQAAINEAKAEGGGLVYVPGKKFYAAGLMIDSDRVSLVGDGICSTLAQIGKSNKSLITVKEGTSSGIANLKLVGNYNENVLGHGINISGTSTTGYVRNVIIEYFPESGIHQDTGSTGVGWGFHQVRSRFNRKYGFHFEGGYDHKFTICVPICNVIGGIYVVQGVANLQFIGCRPNYNGTIDDTNSFDARVYSSSVWVGCQFDNSTWHEVVIDGLNNIFVGCRLHEWGRSKTSGSPAGFRINNNNNIIVANTIQFGDGYGVDLNGTVTKNIIVLNNFHDNTGTNINATVAQLEANYIRMNMGNNEEREYSKYQSAWTDQTVGTPDVAGGSFYQVTFANAGNITNFLNGIDGQELKLLFTNGNATLVDGATLVLAGSVNWNPAVTDTISLILRNSVWYETGRSDNS